MTRESQVHDNPAQALIRNNGHLGSSKPMVPEKRDGRALNCPDSVGPVALKMHDVTKLVFSIETEFLEANQYS